MESAIILILHIYIELISLLGHSFVHLFYFSFSTDDFYLSGHFWSLFASPAARDFHHQFLHTCQLGSMVLKCCPQHFGQWAADGSLSSIGSNSTALFCLVHSVGLLLLTDPMEGPSKHINSLL